MLASSQAKEIVREFLDLRELPYTRLTARIDVEHLIWVKVHGWKPSIYARELDKLVRKHGFRWEVGK